MGEVVCKLLAENTKNKNIHLNATKMSKNAEVAIKQYLVKQNRPYSAIDITNNLHKEFGKTLVERTLEALSESGQIVKKTYGKQKVFCADQSKYPDVDDTELKSMDSQVNQLKNNANTVSPEERTQIMTLRGKYVKEWRKRKRIAMDISNAVLEGYPKSKKEFFEEVGIETDEEYNVKP